MQGAEPFTLLCCRDAAGVAELVASRLLEARQRWPQLPLGLATGRTMEPVYAALQRQVARLDPPARQVLREGWLSFNLDEYVGLAPRDPGSFAQAMAQALQQPLGLAAEQVQLPDGLSPSPEAEALRYGAALQASGGLGLQVLGIGLNGHVGFNEPPCTAELGCRPVELSAATRLQNAAAFHGDPKAVPAEAITLGLVEILAARELLLVATGSSKAAVLHRLLSEDPSPQLPASWLRSHPRLTLVVDAAALAPGPGGPLGPVISST